MALNYGYHESSNKEGMKKPVEAAEKERPSTGTSFAYY